MRIASITAIAWILSGCFLTTSPNDLILLHVTSATFAPLQTGLYDNAHISFDVENRSATRALLSRCSVSITRIGAIPEKDSVLFQSSCGERVFTDTLAAGVRRRFDATYPVRLGQIRSGVNYRIEFFLSFGMPADHSGRFSSDPFQFAPAVAISSPSKNFGLRFPKVGDRSAAYSMRARSVRPGLVLHND